MALKDRPVKKTAAKGNSGAKGKPVKDKGKPAKGKTLKKGPNGKVIKKSKKPQTLKQQQKLESKVVKAGNLNWKPVEIPDNLDDYEGFYGLEEIDGVDVKIVDGKAEFIVQDKRNLKTEAQLEELEKADGVWEDKENKEGNDKEDGKELEDEDEEEEFTGFDDIAEPKAQDNQKEAQDNQKEEASNKQDKDEELLQNAFKQLDLPLPDDDDIDLPAWTDQEKGLELSAYTLNGLSSLKFNQPTPIQKRTIPLALQGKDVIGKATTGSGKTLAYGIPILEKHISKINHIKNNLKNKKINSPSGIIFAPTRELAHQVVDHLNKIAQYSPLSQHGIVTITGGLSIQKQERLLSHGPGIIVATPGRFLELCQQDEELAKRLACTDILVLDEADRLLQDGHFEEFEKILELFHKHRPRNDSKIDWKWQTLVFSATFSTDLFGKLDKGYKKGQKSQISGSLIDNEGILNLLTEKLKFKDAKPSLIDANPKEIVSGQITETLVECGPTERDLYLYYFLLMYSGSTLVFANSIDSVKRLVPLLNNLKIPAFSIHSSMIQKQRLRALERFKEASEKNSTAVLIASDVAARGLDISNIDHVAHYHLPRSADVYIHRSGRTARAGKEGVSVIFCSPQEASGPFKKLRKMVASSSENNARLNVHNDVKLLPIEMDIISQIKPRVKLAAKLSDANLSNTATRKEDSWVKQAADDLGLEDLSDIENFEDDIIKKQRKRKEGKTITKEEAKQLKFQLNELLNTQLRKNHRRSYLTSGLENLAHQMVSGKTHQQILGHKESKALDELRKKPQSKAKINKKKNKEALGKISKPVKK